MGNLFLILSLILSSVSYAQSLPPILQVIQTPPQTLEDIEQLVEYRWFDKALEALKPYPQEDQQVIFLTAKSLMGVSRYEEAFLLFQTLEKQVLSKIKIRDLLLRETTALVRLKRYPEAIDLYQKLIEHEYNKSVKKNLYWRAFKTALESKAYGEGLRLLKHLSGTEVLWWRGWCHFRLGDLKHALKTWETISPKSASALQPRLLYWKAILYEELQEHNKAQELFVRLLQKYPLSFYSFLSMTRLDVAEAALASVVPVPEKYPLEYEEIIRREAKLRKLDPYLIFALILQESHFRESILSPVGAMGLMQLMPQTALKLEKAAKIRHFNLANIIEPPLNIKLGSFYLKFLQELFSNRIPYMLASYNAGEEAVSRWLTFRENDPLEVFIEEITFDETRDYVRKVMTAHYIYHWLYEGKLPAEK